MSINCECSICLESLTTDLATIPCGHIFHYNCLQKHIEQSNICPLCTRPFSTKCIILLYTGQTSNKSEETAQTTESVSYGNDIIKNLEQITKSVSSNNFDHRLDEERRRHNETKKQLQQALLDKSALEEQIEQLKYELEDVKTVKYKEIKHTIEALAKEIGKGAKFNTQLFDTVQKALNAISDQPILTIDNNKSMFNNISCNSNRTGSVLMVNDDISTNFNEYLATFDDAADKVKKLKTSPSNDELLEIYALFKQATVGDNNTSKPGMLDPKGKAKWSAWDSKKETLGRTKCN